MKKNIPDSILDIIYAVLNDSQTESQEKQLETWLNEDAENRELFKEYLSLHQKIKSTRLKDGIDRKKAWKNIEKKVKKHDSYRIQFRNKLVKYAASLAILITLGAGLYVLVEKEQPPQKTSYDELITPRKNQALLTLSTGEVVEINKKIKKYFNEPNATIIKDDTNNYLQYRQANQQKQASAEPVYNTLTIPRSGKYKLILSDSTVVWLNSETTLKYPVSFTGKERMVQLEGEAYFEIAQNRETPFIVETNGMRIEATGTSFNVMAYSEDKKIEATLVEGRINVYTEDQHRNVEPGKQASFQREQKELSINSVNTSYYTSWVQGVFKFNNTRMREIAKRLHRWYDVNISFRDTIAPELRFTGVIDKNESIEKLFRVIEATDKVELTVKEKEVLVSKK
ncbi:MAG: FecR family protein [Bacteroidales bacterium]|nr:FecR family protein [Bacteroidales bacterium]MCF8338181.1 FecR family protein [Bacteroidales bacterium]